MAEKFDPYHVWLGIPPAEQPAHYYRLLAIPLFEESPDVIENAADRQMAHLRRLSSGKHGELSQKLLNEISTARVCLLNASQKQKYDAQLRSTYETAEFADVPPTIAATQPQAPPLAVATFAPPTIAPEPARWKAEPSRAASVAPISFAVSSPAVKPRAATPRRGIPSYLWFVVAIAAALPVLALVVAIAVVGSKGANDDLDASFADAQEVINNTLENRSLPLPGEGLTETPGEPHSEFRSERNVSHDERDPFDDRPSYGTNKPASSSEVRREQLVVPASRTMIPLALLSLPGHASTGIRVEAGEHVKLKVSGIWRLGPQGGDLRGPNAMLIAVGSAGQIATQHFHGQETLEFTVQKPGFLFMAMEDLFPHDNQGEMNVAVEICKQK